jgi:D-serine deaminase-like pyridoxal phosphate-dependent protein
VSLTRSPERSDATTWARLESATAGLDAPFAVVDLKAFDANALDMVRRAGGTPIRVASKSVRCRELLRRVLAVPGYAGVLAYSLREALWLAAGDVPVSGDVVVGYPSADRGAIAALASSEAAAEAVTLMVDSVEQLDHIDSVVGPSARPSLRICLDLDASLRLFGGLVHLGVRRSPVHTPAEAAALARAVAARPGFRLAGLMAYEAQVAGVGDQPPGRPFRGVAVRGMQALSVRSLAERRQAVVAAVSAVTALEFVNGGGTGSLERTSREPWVTELAAGSGLYGPTLFDAYRAFTPAPAAVFAVQVVRRPGPGLVTVAGGGWPASGPPGEDRVPRPVHPAGLRLLPAESAGEVQTPLRGTAADSLEVGDRVWFRHAKAGELCERVDVLHLVGPSGDEPLEQATPVPTYRGEQRTFG